MTEKRPQHLMKHSERKIDRIASEISGILHAIGEPVPQPTLDHDPSARRRINQARERQLLERERFLKRYQPAIMAFIGTILQDSDAVTEVWEGFVEKWLCGKLSRFDPSKGSFRKYLKTVLRNACRQHWIELSKRREVTDAGVEYEQNDVQSEAENAFDRRLKAWILEAAIESVGQEDKRHYEIVKCVIQSGSGNGRTTKEIGEHLTLQLGENYSSSAIRQMKKRAKARLAEKLIEQTGLVLDSCLLNDVEETMAELGLLHFCRTQLDELRR